MDRRCCGTGVTAHTVDGIDSGPARSPDTSEVPVSTRRTLADVAERLQLVGEPGGGRTNHACDSGVVAGNQDGFAKAELALRSMTWL